MAARNMRAEQRPPETRMKLTKVLIGCLVGWAAVAVPLAPPAGAEPSAEELRQTIRDYIQWHQDKLGSFTLPDSKQIGKLRTLSLIRVHERVGKTGDYYYSCTDMKDVASGDELDLDFDVSDQGEKLQVVAVRIHKDNGKPRYTYGENDNLIPLE